MLPRNEIAADLAHCTVHRWVALANGARTERNSLRPDEKAGARADGAAGADVRSQGEAVGDAYIGDPVGDASSTRPSTGCLAQERR